MNKVICILLIVCFVLPFCGCNYDDGIQEPVYFYYRNIEFDYSSDNIVIAPEIREAAGHIHDPEYLLSLYLIGPSDPFLQSPFPKGTKLINSHIQDRILTVQLSSQVAHMNDLDFTLACACFAKTCFSITDIDQVKITAGNPSRAEYVEITMTPDDILEIDDSAPVS